MIRVNDEVRLTDYISQYDIKSIFSTDMSTHMELLFYKKYDFMAKEGEEIPYLLFLTEGKAKVFTSLSNGKSLLLCFYQGFKVLGDLEAVDSVRAVTNVQAIADTYCVGIPYGAVRRYLLEDAKFLRYICSSLGRKLSRCSKNSSINLLYPLENRLASYICTAGERVQIDNLKKKDKRNENSSVRNDYSSNSSDRKYAVKKEVLCFHENLTEIAELLGTSYRHLLRTLSELTEKNILRKEGSSYFVTDEETLMELSSDLYK